jgi:hypothetical protein
MNKLSKKLGCLSANDDIFESAEFATMDDIRSLQVDKADRSEPTALQARVEALEKQFGLVKKGSMLKTHSVERR